jgi:hypothetical protein
MIPCRCRHPCRQRTSARRAPRRAARWNACRAGILVCAAVLAGCQPWDWNPPAPAPPATGVQINPCEERLHDVVCEQLMMYYAVHKELPPTLEALQQVDPSRPLECPVSGKPYVYNREGLEVSGWAGRLILYDSEPIHDGHRWGIVADVPRPGKPFAVRAARPPEGAIRWQPRSSEPTPRP